MTEFALTHPSTEADARARETDHDERGDSPTPRGLWRAIFEVSSPVWLNPRGVMAGAQKRRRQARSGVPFRALSLMAGYGSDASELRRLAVRQGWRIHITGVELCEARRVHLVKWCDDVWIGHWMDALLDDGPLENPQWDIIVTNPDFAQILDNKNKALRPEDTMVPTLLQNAPSVLMLHQEQAFTKSARGREVWRRWPPAASWMLGPASFSGDGKADSRCYIATLWLRGHEGPTALHMLPELDAAARRWTVPPGSEDPSSELPSAPGWRA